MKKNSLITSTLFLFGAFTLVSCEKEEVISNSKVPSEIANYVSVHFPEHKIIQVEEEKEFFDKSYDVLLEGFFSLEFNKKFEITDIDGVSKLPDSVIPELLRQYVDSNYAGNFITNWELDDKNQQVELETGLEIEFTMQGDFIRIDD